MEPHILDLASWTIPHVCWLVCIYDRWYFFHLVIVVSNCLQTSPFFRFATCLFFLILTKVKISTCLKLCNKASKLQLPKLITSSCLKLTSFINVFLCCLTNCFIIYMWELSWFVQNKTRWKGMNLFCLYKEQITYIFVHWFLVYNFFQCRHNNQEMQYTFLSMHFHLHCIKWNVSFKLLIVY
jgi:hypothetical protein